MKVDKKLYNAALKFLNERFPNNGEGGVATMYTNTGKILLSTYADSPNCAACLCYETGAICEAHKLNEKITATICLSREKNKKPIVLTPCGICQERLAFWGLDISIAVPKKENSTEYMVLKLSEIQPHYWHRVFEGE